MYFTNTPSLNSMEAIMKRPPGGIQRGGGRKRKPSIHESGLQLQTLPPLSREKKAVPFPFVRCWTSGWNAAPPL